MLLQLLPPDGSMPYTETNLGHFFPEPWNMVTSAIFLVPAIYWLIQLKGFDKKHAFLSLAVWLLLTATIGSTIFHGLRQWRFFMYMDWVPIALLCVFASIYFIIKVTGKWYYGLASLAAFGLIEFVLHELYLRFDKHIMFSVNYGVMVLMIVLPLVLLLIKTKWRNILLVAGAFVFFGLALYFRIVDTGSTWPMGTHFLWHGFGAVATSMIFLFVYRLNSLSTVTGKLQHEATVLPLYNDGLKGRTGS
ncbi:MAG: hypothetical protein ABIN95_13890 [Mucilaginibacter sp.]